MARITVEDCIEKVSNRFHLIQMAAIRTKQLKKGAQPFVSADDNKDVVVSLREIAAGYVKPDYPSEIPEGAAGEAIEQALAAQEAAEPQVEAPAEEAAPEAEETVE